MKCLCCGGDNLETDTRTVKGVPDVTGDFCPDCGEVVLDGVQGDRLIFELREQPNRPTASPGLRIVEGNRHARLRLAAMGGEAPDMTNIPRRRG